MTADFHCHLDLYQDPYKVVSEVQRRNVAVLSVTTTPSAFRGTSRLAASSPRVQTALGLHPELAAEREHELPLFDQLVGETRFVGEVGLDGSRRFASDREVQRRVFEHVLRTCADVGGRVLTVHSRLAVDPVLSALTRVPGAGLPVLHWFTGTPQQAEAAVNAGCWFSVGPAMLATAKGIDLVQHVPRNRVLTETDGPFAIVDGSPAYPWHVDRAVELLAEAWGATTLDVTAQLDANFSRLISASVSPGT